jgi:hypothetical protein
MPFIRQNLFLIVLAGITVVLVGGLLVVNSGVADDIDQQIKMRAGVAASLGQLKAQAQKKDLVNQVTIDKLKAHVQAVKELSTKITSESAEWNKRNYKPFPYTVGDQTDKFIPAFPLKEADTTSTLAGSRQAQGMARQYVKEVDGLIAKLSPTWVPDDAAIKEAQRLTLEKLSEDLPIKDDATTDKPKPRIGSDHPPVDVPAGPTEAEIKAKAEKEGMLLAVVKRSDEGLVYINKDMAIGQVLSGTELNASHAELWEAQLQLWILKDIVAAIDQTNQQALSGQGGGEVKRVAVSNGAIKQLVALQIDRCYALGEAIEPASGAGNVGTPAGSTFNPVAPRPAAAGGDSGIKGGQCLTQRVTTNDYDVKRYTLTMVMATRYLKDFERYLMQRNYHTVLSVKIEPAARLGADAGKFNFGPEPVVMVTINGELLLLSGWERALMPKDVLEEWVPKSLR